MGRDQHAKSQRAKGGSAAAPSGPDGDQDKDFEGVAARLRSQARLARGLSESAKAAKVASNALEALSKAAIPEETLRRLAEVMPKFTLPPETLKAMASMPKFTLPPETLRALAGASKALSRVTLPPEMLKRIGEAMPKVTLPPEMLKRIGEAMPKVTLPPETLKALEAMSRVAVSGEAMKRLAEGMSKSAIPPETRKAFMLPGEAAERLGITRERLRQLTQEGALTPLATTRVGRLFDPDDVSRLAVRGWEGRRVLAARRCAVDGCAIAGDDAVVALANGMSLRSRLCSEHRESLEHPPDEELPRGGYL